MPPHDDTSPVAPRAGSVRRPPPERDRNTSGGGGRPGERPTPGSRGRTTASRAGQPARGARPAPGRPPARGSATRKRPAKARTRRQRVRRRLGIAAGVLGGLFLLFCVFIGVVYASTEVPTLDSVQTNQKTIVYYSDGVTEMARLGDENRTNVSIDQISEPARNAVLAAENRNFYSDPGISFSGIVRATWNNLTGGSQQGGSTITQQYVGLAFLNNGNSYKEKFQELFLAVKLDNSVSKDDILESYLNTIYFGRGAYGIEAAAQTYFNVPAAQLTAEQGAVLAVLIRNPSFYDPETNLEGASDRWGLVLDGMVGEGWLTAAQRAAAVYPPINPKGTTNQIGFPEGPEGLIVSQVQNELQGDLYQFDDQQINSGGLRVVTTIDANRQRAAVETVNDVLTGESEDLRQALVSIDPRTGAVVAYYGGPNGSGTDYAQVRRQPGSSMKPYVLATALQEGISVNARRDGSSPQTFPDRRQPVTNSGNAQCGSCTLVQAMTRSLNTTFYGLAYEVGPDEVRQTALAATGMPEVWPPTGNPDFDNKKTLANADGDTGSAIGIGEYEMRPIDQAVGFATLANNGIRHSPFFVARVTGSDGTLLGENGGDAGVQAIPADVASDTTFAMEGVAAYSKRSLDGNRPVASKTGTQGIADNRNSDAWMVGYTPSLSTAVWMGSDARLPLISAGSNIFGSGLPGAIWQDYMDAALDGTPVEPLPRAPIIRGDTGNSVPEPTTSAPTTSRPAPTTTSAPEPTTESPDPTTEAPVTTAPTTTAPAPPTTQAPASGRPSADPVPTGGAGRPTGTNSRAPGNGAQPSGTAQPSGSSAPSR